MNSPVHAYNCSIAGLYNDGNERHHGASKLKYYTKYETKEENIKENPKIVFAQTKICKGQQGCIGLGQQSVWNSHLLVPVHLKQQLTHSGY